MRGGVLEISKRIDCEGRNWGRWCLTDGDNPIPKSYKEASWAKFYTPDDYWRRDYDMLPPPVDCRSARVVHGVYKSLPLVCKHVMSSYWVGNYIYGRPRAERETVRLLNILVQAKRLDVPEGFQFTYHQYISDMRYIICPRMEVALEICA